MIKKSLFLFAIGSMAFSSVCRADSLGVAGAFNLVALNGNISESSDVGGRVAASGEINVPQVGLGGSIVWDGNGSLANGYIYVAGNGAGANSNTHIMTNGNVYASAGNSANYQYNSPYTGTVTTTGASPINFGTLRSSLDSESLYLAGLASTPGEVVQIGGDSHCGSCLELKGTSTLVNVFNITAAQLSSVNNPLDIVVPAGATAIINVSGTSDSLGGADYINGTQPSETSNAGAYVLFNFASATSVTLNGQLNGSLLAPLAGITGNSSIDGTVIGSSINTQGEVHNDEFLGTLPGAAATPEPSSLMLLGTGILGAAGLLRRRSID